MKINYYLRGISNIFRYLFKELPRGVEFSLRDLSTTYEENHGYALTTKKALKNILKGINLDKINFLDIGSGKGGVICYAYELGAKTSTGLEYEKKLHLKAQKNIKRLNYQNKVNSLNIDARLFEDYGKFNIFFMFNPFGNKVYEEVVKKILLQTKSIKSEKYLIAYGGANTKFLNKSERLSLNSESICPYRKNSIRIYKLN